MPSFVKILSPLVFTNDKANNFNVVTRRSEPMTTHNDSKHGNAMIHGIFTSLEYLVYRWVGLVD